MSITTLRILLADDSLPSLMTTQIMLEKMGHEVMVATDGEQALALALRDRFDLLLLDEYMPGLPGSAVTMRLRASTSENNASCIIALSGVHKDEERQRLLDSGIDELIIKPVTADRLKLAVTKFFPISSTSIDADVVAKLIIDLGDEVGQRLLGLFVEELVQMSVRVTQALKNDDLEEFLAVSHILKNSASLYGATDLADFARELNENTERFAADMHSAANTLLACINDAHHAAKEYALAAAQGSK